MSGRREDLRKMAADTLNVIDRGSYKLKNKVYHLHTESTQRNTRFYPPNSGSLSNWSSHPPTHHHAARTYVNILEISTLRCARLLHKTLRNSHREQDKIGVLNFASATQPGGELWNGDHTQEESISRSSTLFPTLVTPEAQKFYYLHKYDARNPYYTDSMIYSPGVEAFRDDDGKLRKPLEIDVLSSAAVNAHEVRQSHRARAQGRITTEKEIEFAMKQRMALILFLFEKERVRNIILGSFGTGVLQNDVSVVARLWAELLGARFERSFDRVFFAILGRQTLVDFGNAFNQSLGRSGGGSKMHAVPSHVSCVEKLIKQPGSDFFGSGCASAAEGCLIDIPQGHDSLPPQLPYASRSFCLLCRRNPKIGNWDFCGDACNENATRKTPLLMEVPKGHVTFEMVEDKFKAAWNCPKGQQCPPLKMVCRVVENPTTRAQYDRYKSRHGNECFRYHGTSRTCRIGEAGNRYPCWSPTCPACCILRTSFQVNLAKQSGAFGPGIYTSSASNKSSKYAPRLVTNPTIVDNK